MLERLTEAPVRLLSTVRYAYYVFIFSIAFETLDIGMEGGVFSLSKLVGVLFLLTALLQPQVCFKKPPRPFWYFLAYILICGGLAAFQSPQFLGPATMQLFTLVLMLILFWVSYNLLHDKSMVKGAFLSMIGSCAVLALLLLLGFGQAGAQDRLTAMSQNANALGSTLSIGLLTLLGLAYGRDDIDRRIRLLLWICFGGIAAGIVGTGSRSSMLGLMAGIILLIAKRGHFALKVQVGFMAFLAVAALVWISYDNEAVRIRWESALEGNLSRREEIHPEAWNMFTEKPFLGWGPITHYVELGARFGRAKMDPHNLYLWIMTETGLLGAVPFFIGLWICLRTAWRARYGPEGSLPIALITCLLIVNMSGSLQLRKVFWIVLAYSLASDLFLSKRWHVAHPAGSIHPVGYGLRQS